MKAPGGTTIFCFNIQCSIKINCLPNMEREVKPNDHFEFSNMGNAENNDVNE